jgi:hypothetical protein
MPLTDDDAAKVAKAVFNLNVGADGVNWGVALQRLYNRPAVTAQDIAAAIVAQFKTLPAGTATVDDATIAKVAQATATEARHPTGALNRPNRARGGADPRGRR